jgi:coatomer subunit beta'
MALQVTKEATYRVYSVKFIAQEKWFAAGVGYGHVRVYDYTSTTKNNVIKKIRAHGGKPVTSLAVHPTYPYLLTSSQDDNLIKLWDWGQGWLCTRTFDGHTGGVGRFKFSRRDSNSLASVGYDNGEAKVLF